MKSLFLPLLSLLTSTVSAASRTSPPSSSCLSVGSGQKYTTIQSAIDALSTTSSGPQCIFIYPGTYREQVLIPARSAQLSIYGSTSSTLTYSSNTVTITASKSQADGLSNDETATVRVKSQNARLYNLNVENGYGKGSQAVALSVYAEGVGIYGCSLTGFQDTLLAQEGSQLYARTLIQGATDFIFGQRAPAWFEKCDVKVVTASVGYITASGRDSSSNPNNYVFNACTVAAADGNTVASGAYYLGRPWREYARVTFQKTSMTNVINAAGWKIWNTGDERTSNVAFTEYSNTGAGASGTRASFSSKLGSAVKIETVLGSAYASQGYYDSSYM
ncbi:pectin lyase fold/virulence factor [Pseudoneurospora amorphoporcata]|uniref:Pectinesterase n=1 Tax=Pseudoneurospora amorphoporcata TaxID=241081 RepID=A0AAN6P2Q5_9PEZI|nr:pectin lyase fold/virulence factor [Pseudoneurospora amorphoporcata]